MPSGASRQSDCARRRRATVPVNEIKCLPKAANERDDGCTGPGTSMRHTLHTCTMMYHDMYIRENARRRMRHATHQSTEESSEYRDCQQMAAKVIHRVRGCVHAHNFGERRVSAAACERPCHA